MDVFTWSVPFLAEKVISMLYNIIKVGENLSDDEDEPPVGNVLRT